MNNLKSMKKDDQPSFLTCHMIKDQLKEVNGNYWNEIVFHKAGS